MQCPECEKEMVKNGWRKNKDGGRAKQRWACFYCGHSLTEGGLPPHRPKVPHAMSSTERSRKRRERLKAQQQAQREESGIIEPSPEAEQWENELGDGNEAESEG